MNLNPNKTHRRSAKKSPHWNSLSSLLVVDQKSLSFRSNKELGLRHWNFQNYFSRYRKLFEYNAQQYHWSFHWSPHYCRRHTPSDP